MLAFTKAADLRYGENPHQRGAYYAEQGARVHLLSRVEQLHGKELSLINLLDLSAARMILSEFTLPACVIVKHANPCGVAVAGTIEGAYERALVSDPVSAFGMVCAVNRPVSAGLGEALAERFIDVLLAPGYDDAALDALRGKQAIRILHDRERRGFPRGERDVKRVLGGLLVQDRDWDVDDREGMEVACGFLSEETWGDLVFAWRVCKHVGSNAIVIAKDLATIGLGGGQTSRVDAVKLALDKAREHGHDVPGAVLASDAFFPFPDGPQAALEAGITAIIQPERRRDDGPHRPPPLPALKLFGLRHPVDEPPCSLRDPEPQADGAFLRRGVVQPTRVRGVVPGVSDQLLDDAASFFVSAPDVRGPRSRLAQLVVERREVQVERLGRRPVRLRFDELGVRGEPTGRRRADQVRRVDHRLPIPAVHPLESVGDGAARDGD